MDMESARTAAVHPRKPRSLSRGVSAFGIGFFMIGAAEKVVHADMIEVGQFHKCIDRIVQNTDLILRIGILTDAKYLCHLLLRIVVVNTQTADIFELHYFVSHIITHETVQYLKTRYCILSGFQIYWRYDRQ